MNLAEAKLVMAMHSPARKGAFLRGNPRGDCAAMFSVGHVTGKDGAGSARLGAAFRCNDGLTTGRNPRRFPAATGIALRCSVGLGITQHADSFGAAF
jgi:hypothetical protein